MLRVDFINVGYGDSILIRAMEQDVTYYTMLIDAGDTDDAAHYEQGRIRTVDYLAEAGVERINTLLLTHLHKDHVGGMPAVISKFPVEQVVAGYYPPEAALSPEKKFVHYKDGALSLARGADAWRVSVSILRANGTTCTKLADCEGRIELAPGLTVSYLQGWKDGNERQKRIFDRLLGPESGPTEGELLQLDRFINNLSITLVLEHQGLKIALLGDVYLGFWREHSIPENCRIVKLPHHGHADAVSEELLRTLSPDWAVVSVSNDRTDDCPCARLADMTDIAQIECTDRVRPFNSAGGKALRFDVTQDRIAMARVE